MTPAVSTFKPDSKLEPFEGQEVRNARVAITNAGDGLSKALSVDPEEWQIGDTVFVTLRCDVTKVAYQPLKDEEGVLSRVHTLRATDATVVDPGVVQQFIDDQRDRIQRAREQEAGIQRFPTLPDREEFDEEEE